MLLDKKSKKKLLYYAVLPLLIAVAATLILGSAAPFSQGSFQGYSTAKGFPVAWWRSVQSEQPSFWPINTYKAYDQAALIMDVFFFYIVFAVVIVLLHKFKLF